MIEYNKTDKYSPPSIPISTLVYDEKLTGLIIFILIISICVIYIIIKKNK